MKTFNEDQMANPWRWCLTVVEKHGLTSKIVADATGAPRSTLRALFNGSNANPRYELLTKIVRLCIDIENGGGYFPGMTGKQRRAAVRAQQKVASTQPTIEDFL